MYTKPRQPNELVSANLRCERTGIYVSPNAANIDGDTSSILIFLNAVVGGQ